MKNMKTVQVIMLPIDKATWPQLFKSDISGNLNFGEPFNKNICTTQHLYLVSGDEIKNENGTIINCNVGDYIIKLGKICKITHIGSSFNFKGTIELDNSERVVVSLTNNLRIIIATTATLAIHKNKLSSIVDFIPHISTSFVEAYAKSNGTIKEVQVEMEYYCKAKSKDHGGNIAINDIRIKTRPDNSVIIHQIKQDISFEDMIEFVKYYSGMKQESIVKAYNRWIIEQ